MNPDQPDQQWRLRWWLADTLRPYALIIYSGVIGALLVAAAATDPLLAAIGLIVVLAAICRSST